MSALLDQLAAPPTRRPVSVGVLANVRPEWDFDMPAIERAARGLGIKRPIVLATTRGLTAAGRHFYRRDERGLHHEIRVSAIGYSAFGASEVLWHELAHARQSEDFADPGEWQDEYDSWGRKGPAYRANPYEVEAGRFETFAREQPLAR